MKKIVIIALVVLVLGGGIFAIGYFTFGKDAFEDAPWQEPPTITNVVDDVLAQRQTAIEGGESEVDFGSEDEINVLLLGLDSRKGNREPHCDAIHMFTINIEDWTIKITSVPRGTYSYIPPGTYESNQYYISNACAFAGLDYGIEQIEGIVGVQADYFISVGFSQAIGVFRLLDMPTTETLQWLRNRHTYAIGDPQRSHNQAVFFKDMIIDQLDRFRHELTPPIQYVGYRMVETNMDFGTARALLNGLLESEIDKRPDDITLAMKPYYATVDYHFDIENPEQQIEAIADFLKPYLGEDDLSGKTVEDIQNDLIDYMESRLDSGGSVADIMDKRLWLQLEDEEVREELHFAFTERYVEQIVEDDPDLAIEIWSEYVLEKEALGIDEYAAKGRRELSDLL
ncbi:MAG: LCP family protein [Patescibacteria group bacterium]